MIGNALYSIVLDYRGGTYVAQVHADSEEAALKHWVYTIRDRGVSSRKLVCEGFRSLVEREAAVQLEGCVNAWCLSGVVRGHLALLNVFKTDRN